MANIEPPAPMGVERIARERARQISEEGYDDVHDDEHGGSEIAMAAACYAASAADKRIYVMEEFAASVSFIDPWPWDERFDNRPYYGNVLQEPESDAQRIRMLEKAGALIAAEIDRLLRRQMKRSGEGGKKRKKSA